MSAQIIINMIEGQPTSISGPLENKQLCYHMILDAILALIAYEPKQILPVGVLPFDPSKKPSGSGPRLMG